MKLITAIENGTAWIEGEDGEIYGIVDAFKVTDGEGLIYEYRTVCDMFDDIEQNYELECNVMHLEDGIDLYIYNDHVEVNN